MTIMSAIVCASGDGEGSAGRVLTNCTPAWSSPFWLLSRVVNRPVRGEKCGRKNTMGNKRAANTVKVPRGLQQDRREERVRREVVGNGLPFI